MRDPGSSERPWSASISSTIYEMIKGELLNQRSGRTWRTGHATLFAASERTSFSSRVVLNVVTHLFATSRNSTGCFLSALALPLSVALPKMDVNGPCLAFHAALFLERTNA